LGGAHKGRPARSFVTEGTDFLGPRGTSARPFFLEIFLYWILESVMVKKSPADCRAFKLTFSWRSFFLPPFSWWPTLPFFLLLLAFNTP